MISYFGETSLGFLYPKVPAPVRGMVRQGGPPSLVYCTLFCISTQLRIVSAFLLLVFLTLG